MGVGAGWGGVWDGKVCGWMCRAWGCGSRYRPASNLRTCARTVVPFCHLDPAILMQAFNILMRFCVLGEAAGCFHLYPADAEADTTDALVGTFAADPSVVGADPSSVAGAGLAVGMAGREVRG